ncbi:UNVERIFIED_CONTAM: hypothetical protein Sradi_5646300 [Sesamum radiatum]|uniref:SWIM-type domain-containing protein n=1 Tax=Sesamum radiatum TaxID=300843 RepID=A0AAW2KZS3_SESRA
MANPEMSQQWGEYMSLLANEELPSSCNPDFGTGTSNPDFGAGTSNYGADDYYPSMVAVTSGLKNIAIYHSEPSQSQIHVSENFTPHQDAAVDPILDTFGNLSDASSEPDEVDYPIPPEDGPNDVDINIMAENFAQVREGSDFVSPHGAHRYCLRHVCSNFNTHYKNVILKDLCWRAGSEYQIRKFNRIMEEIKSQNIAAFEFLDKINKEKWTTSHDGGWRTGILTTNMSECINGVLKGTRRLPLTAIVEITLVRTVNYFVTRERRSHAMVANGQLWTDFAYKMFNQWHQKSIDHTVTKYNHRQQSASVATKRQSGFGLNTHVVKITNRECSCGKLTQFGISCSHAQKVCAAYNINAASMVKNYYDVQAYKNTYSKAFQPLYPEDYWDAPEFRLVHDTTIRISLHVRSKSNITYS